MKEPLATSELADAPPPAIVPVRTLRAVASQYRLEILGCAILLALMTLPVVSQSRYIIYVGTLVALQAALATSLNLILGYTGQFALSHSAFYGLGAYVSALLITALNLTFWAALPLAVIFAGILAVLIGYPALRFTGGIHFALITFAFGELVRLIIANWHEVTNGPQGMVLSYVPESILGIDFSTNKGMYALAASTFLLTLLTVALIRRSRFGRACVAVREDEILASSFGINVTWTKIGAFVISAMLAALAGAIYAPFVNFISPEMLVASDSVSMVGMLIVGGVGTLSGPIIGTFIFIVIPELLRPVAPYRLAILGSVVVLTVLFMPSGVTGLIRRLTTRRPHGRSDDR